MTYEQLSNEGVDSDTQIFDLGVASTQTLGIYLDEPEPVAGGRQAT